MNTENLCPLCKVPAQFGPMTAENGPVVRIDCPGGQYRLTREASAILNATDTDFAEVRGWVYDQNLLGVVPLLNTEALASLRKRPPFSIAEKIDRLLLALVRDRSYPAGPVPVRAPHLAAATHAKDDKEVRWIGTFLDTHGWARFGTSLAHLPDEASPWDSSVTVAAPTFETLLVTPEGYLKAEELFRKATPSAQGFVAMSFSEEMRSVFDRAIDPAILAAGYRPLRVDRTEHINKIDDEIIAQIRRSRFVVADFTEHRSGVYFEVGYALGREVPVIWCCRKDQVKDLHFDVRQFNCVDWQTPEELCTRLQVRIEAAIGDGPLKPTT